MDPNRAAYYEPDYGDDDEYYDEEEEMPATERELAEDAQWKLIQKNTFTRWANEHLKTVNKQALDIEYDFCDGLRLIALIEVLSGKQFARFNRRPNFRTQKLENVTMCLKFLEQDEGIRIVNIDSSDIVDSKLKLILGLIWTLILHYSISMPMWEGDDERPQETPKQRLLHWVQNKIPDRRINNFTTDWNDGTAIGALVDSIAPGLCPDWEDWNPRNAVDNAGEAMDAAEEWLEVPQLIKPEEMTNPKVDELSMMTYLSQYPNAKVKSGAPLRPRTNAARVRAYGPGVAPEGNSVNNPAIFTVETFGAGRGDVEVIVLNPKGQAVPCTVVFNNDRNLTYTCTYIPKSEGRHTVIVKYTGKEVPKSPYQVFVSPPLGDPSLVRTYGRGLDPEGNQVMKPTEFRVETAEAGAGDLAIQIVDPRGQPVQSNVQFGNDKNQTYTCTYVPRMEGVHTVQIMFCGEEVAMSPYRVNIKPQADAAKVKAFGKGLAPEGNKANEPTEFTVDVVDAGSGELEIELVNSRGQREQVHSQFNNGRYTCTYTPRMEGRYTVTMRFAGKPVPRSPFQVLIASQADPSKVKAYGQGLKPEGNKAQEPAFFTVETGEAGNGDLGIEITDPRGQREHCQVVFNQDQNLTYTCSYTPRMEGRYSVSLRFGGKEVPRSPYQVLVSPRADPSLVKAYGKGLQAEGNKANEATEFTVETFEAGKGEVKVEITNPRGGLEHCSVSFRNDYKQSYVCSYTPTMEGRYSVAVKFDNKPIPRSPFQVFIAPLADPSKVRAYGPGLSPEGNKVNQPAEFTVDTGAAGKGDVEVELINAKGQREKCSVAYKNGKYACSYTPKGEGRYTVGIKFAGKPVPNSPFNVLIDPAADASRVKAYGPGLTADGAKAGEKTNFTVETAEAGQGDVTIEMINPRGQVEPVHQVFNRDAKKSYSCSYTPKMEGRYTISIRFAGQEIPRSPFNVLVAPEADPSKVRVYGKGVRPEGNQADEPAEFTIDTGAAGKGAVEVEVINPKGHKEQCDVSFNHDRNKTYSCAFMPTMEGRYTVNVRYASQHVPGSPYQVFVHRPVEEVIERVQQPPVQQEIVEEYEEEERTTLQKLPLGASSEVSFRVLEPDISVLTANITSPSGLTHPCALKRLKNGHLGIAFTPQETGEHRVNVFKGGQHIKNSPYLIYVEDGEIGNASKVKTHGRGLREGLANQINEFFVNTKEAGYGGLSLSIEGPSKAEIECHENEDNCSCHVTYRPTEPGNYIVNVKFADEHVPGSPFMVKIGGEATEALTEKIIRQQETADVTHVGSQCELSLKLPGTNAYEMEAAVTSPSQGRELCQISTVEHGHYSIKFIPKEMGIHTVSVKNRGMHIPGSPFQFTVGPIRDGGAHKVTAVGRGLETGVCGQQNEFTLYTREAGAGGLSLAVEGPSKAEMYFQDQKDGTCSVLYTCTTPGSYLVTAKFNDEHIPGSPFRVEMLPNAASISKASEAIQARGLQVNTPAAFTLDFNGMRGALDARVVAPSGAEDEAIIQEVEPDRYAVRFVPRENGMHHIHVKINGQHINGSPFRVMVGIQNADASLVHAYGDGLVKGVVGNESEFVVNTQSAGSGALAVTVDGPSKVQLQCNELEEGYRFKYSPTAPGMYHISVKYAGEMHIPGSPFKAYVTGPDQLVQKPITVRPNAQKAVAKGTGLQRAFINEEAHFTVDTRNAGHSTLMVGVVGPKYPCEEVHIKHQGDQLYTVNYTVKEKGRYRLDVKWGDEHIKGSPFHIEVQ